MSQSLELFTGSLKYNIEYGLKDCPIEKVRKAAKTATADDVFFELTDGYDTGTNKHTHTANNRRHHVVEIIV